MSGDNTDSSKSFSTVGNTASQAMGYVKSAIGGLTGNQETKESGDSQYYAAKGEADQHKKEQEREKKINDLKNDPKTQAGQGVIQTATGTVKNVAGGLLGDEKMAESGRQSKNEGQARFDDNAAKIQKEQAKEQAQQTE
ncbi:hypothetical protein IW139_003243 [Coemansia sp. RSA 353]|nr:hypothetical protein LPJ58_007048 [Coemansia sp. RSA 1591]KAJ2169856.1 hypothetical protein GGH15_000217 [Coemansia sp. RSA 562]KAJ2186941.1 hypothetical protein EV181_003032 [Coemansia sp. RSA 532]KAJ2251164.1 hypothetical protein GGH97_000210 [Coemansia sp. RSA 475]KAJ2268548.1 hypothetical protein J3F81_004662 [Coemansia sp. RSA 371]KAJ2296659.1 hypothetical protein IW139_003243 [Coemansia sp. RSA 353]